MSTAAQRETMYLSIAKEYTQTPGPRSQDEGDFSGEVFLRDYLLPTFKEAQEKGLLLKVDLDGTEGYATSFLEALFGELARKFGIDRVLNGLELKSDDEPYLIDEVMKYIREANAK